MTKTSQISVGVIGVGSMGRHHARVYASMSGVDLVGVADANEERAKEVADNHDTSVRDLNSLVEEVEAASVAVPTAHHYDVAEQCIEAGVDVLVEKPFVRRLSEGRKLISLADTNDVIVQVGHVERFNPAVVTARNILADTDIVAIDADRLGPSLDRDIDDGVVFDLMIHDLDIVLSLVDEPPTQVSGAGSPDGQYATSTLAFESGPIATLTASRRTQRKVRMLRITTEDALLEIDYIDRSVEIHRQSIPEFVVGEEDLRYRHESIVERPMVENKEPLSSELESFCETVRTRSKPEISGEDAMTVLKVLKEVDEGMCLMGESEVTDEH